MASLLERRRRVAFDRPRRSREDRLAAYNALVDNDLRQEEEEEEERVLSEQHGEAAESSTNKREQMDQEIEAEYAKTKKKPRLTLQPSHIMGANGLIAIPSSFRNIRYPNHSDPIEAAGRYSRSLLNAYKTFCHDLFPSMAYEDVLSRIETFGSKREVKAYLNHMRDEVRNQHLEQVFGKEKAEQMVQELENGLRRHHTQNLEDDIGPALIPASPPASLEETVMEGIPASSNLETVNNNLDDQEVPNIANAPETTLDDSDDESVVDWKQQQGTTSKSSTQSESVPLNGSALVDTSDEEDQNDVDEEDHGKIAESTAKQQTTTAYLSGTDNKELATNTADKDSSIRKNMTVMDSEDVVKSTRDEVADEGDVNMGDGINQDGHTEDSNRAEEDADRGTENQSRT